jgi:hypothetical protein
MAHPHAIESFDRYEDLPNELQVFVLAYRLTITNVITSISHKRHSNRALLPLFLTSKATRAFTMEVYYGTNTIVMQNKIVHDRYPG